MKKNEQLDIVKSTVDDLLKLLETKGNDYADEDRLTNFKTMTEMCKLLKVDVTRQEGVHMFYILLKIQRLCNLTFNNKVAMNESVIDTLDDLTNYCLLMKCGLIEIENKKVK